MYLVCGDVMFLFGIFCNSQLIKCFRVVLRRSNVSENDLQRTLVGLMVNVAILNYWIVALQQLSMQSADLCASVLLPPSASLELS